jgi:hypothetical protein
MTVAIVVLETLSACGNRGIAGEIRTAEDDPGIDRRGAKRHRDLVARVHAHAGGADRSL